MEGTLVGVNLFESLLGVNLVKLLGCDGGAVYVDDVERGGQALLALGLGLRQLEVVDGGGTGRPGRAEDPLLLTVQETKVGGGGIGSEEESRFLANRDERSAYMLPR